VTSHRTESTSLWHHRDFLRLWAGDSLSQIGTMITLIAMPLLAIKVLHASVFEVGLLTAAETLAFLVVGLPAGAWVDRMRRRNVLIGADIARALLLGSVPLAWYFDVLTLAQLYVVVLAVGICTVFFDVAYQSYLPHLVGRAHLVEGNAKLQGTQSVAQVAGPALAGPMVQLLTAPYAILVDALTFLWSASWVSAIRSREPKPERSPDRHLLREVREGLSFVLGNRMLRGIAGCTGTSNLFSTMGQTAFIVLLAGAAHLNLSASTIGLFFSVGALGGLVGAVVARPFANLVGQGPAIWLSIVIEGPVMLTYVFIEHGWRLWAAAGAWFVLSVSVVVYNVTQVSFRQGLSPERLLGRMNATMRFLVWGTMPIGGLIGGALGSTIGLRPTLLVSAIGGGMAFLWVFFSPLRWMRELPQHAEEEPSPPPLAQTAAGVLTEEPTAEEPTADEPTAEEPATPGR
jgi:MFS family permease